MLFEKIRKIHFQIWTLTIYIGGSVYLIALSLSASGGMLIYTIDDPYIHLAVAENILQGGYGVNLTEYSSPSSSIIYPFILTIPMMLGFSDWGPLIFGMMANICTLWILTGFIWNHAINKDIKLRGWFFLSIPIFLIFSINAFALPLTGMEHPIHILASVLVMAGLLKMAQQKTVPSYLIFGIILCLLIRFEGMALALSAIAAIFWLRHYTAGFVALGSFIGVLTGYAIIMNNLGLPVFPSSVMAKSTITASAVDFSFIQTIKHILENILRSLDNRWGILFVVTILFSTAWISQKQLSENNKVFALVGIFSLFAHVIFGQYGWFGRYEVYSVAIMIMLVIFIYGSLMTQMHYTLLRAIILPFFLAVISVPYVFITYQTPAGASNIHEQQYQMHRFVNDYFPYPVAVNDLGWVAYQNDQYVLDLLGLGSEEARRLRLTSLDGRTPENLSVLTDKRDIVFAMLYEELFPGAIPDDWCKMAELRTSKVSVAIDRVVFYLIQEDKYEEKLNALKQFKITLPAGSKLEISKCGIS